MKKHISLLLTLLVLVCSFSLSVSAAPVKIECEAALELAGGSNAQDSEFASESQLIGLKPDEVGTDSFALYEILISEDGKYTFTFTYTAAAGDDMLRKADVSMDGVRSPLDLKQTDSWEIFDTSSVTFDLTAGKHELKLLSPSDYDNASVKTPNMDFFTYEKTGDLPKPAEAEPINEVIEETPDVTPPVEVVQSAQASPQTSDAGMLSLILLGAAVCVFAYNMTSKKRI